MAGKCGRRGDSEESWGRADKGSGFGSLSSGTLWTPSKVDRSGSPFS